MTNKPEPPRETPAKCPICGSRDPKFHGDIVTPWAFENLTCEHSWHDAPDPTPEPRRAKGQMEYDKWSDKAFVNRYEKSLAGTPEPRPSDECIVCGATLLPTGTPPHCEDCVVTDEHYEKWEAGTSEPRPHGRETRLAIAERLLAEAHAGICDLWWESRLTGGKPTRWMQDVERYFAGHDAPAPTPEPRYAARYIGDVEAERVVSLLNAAGTPETPEICQNCHQAYGVWFVANEFWNLVIAERTGMLCPNCFIARAERAAIKVTGWQLVPENFAPEPTKEEFAAKKCSRCQGETPSALSAAPPPGLALRIFNFCAESDNTPDECAEFIDKTVMEYAATLREEIEDLRGMVRDERALRKGQLEEAERKLATAQQTIEDLQDCASLEGNAKATERALEAEKKLATAERERDFWRKLQDDTLRTEAEAIKRCNAAEAELAREREFREGYANKLASTQIELARVKEALRLAHEWAAKYPLQEAGSCADTTAAEQVYKACEAALRPGGEKPSDKLNSKEKA